MTTRDAFLAKIRAAQPAPRPRPDVPLFSVPDGERRARFTAALALMGGTCVEAQSLDDVRALIAARFGADAAVVYHGGDTEKYLDETNRIDAPLLMHLGEEDEFISKPAQAAIKAALAQKPNATVYSYPGQYHAFSRHNGAHYNAEAAALAHDRTYEFLHHQLR